MQIGSGVVSTARNKAKGFLALLRSKSVAFFIHFLLDVTTTLTYLSVELQKRDCLLGDVHQKVENTLEALESYKTR